MVNSESIDKLTDSRNSLIKADKSLFTFSITPELKSIESSKIEDKNIKILLNDQNQNFMCKVVLLGDAAVGKTSIQRRYIHQRFSEDYFVTIGTEIAVKNQKIGQNDIKYQIWDIAGQSQFNEVRKSYYSAAAAGIVVCDVTQQNSMANLNNWIKELWTHNGRGPIPFVLVGNKLDLQDDESNASANKILSNFANEINEKALINFGFQIQYLPTSAKTGQNIEEIFTRVGIQIISHQSFIKRKKTKKLLMNHPSII
jgi:Ras-related protein Rab-5C